MIGIKKCLIEYDKYGEINTNINIKNISESTWIEDLKFDSLDKLEFIMLLEEYFNVTINDSDIKDWQTIHDIINYIIKKVD